ncbi:hypothetical protein HDU81_007940, partial [Chytriomyces hyalinus]
MKIAIALLFSLAAVSAYPYLARLEQHEKGKDVNPPIHHIPHYQKHYQNPLHQKHHGKNGYKKPVVAKHEYKKNKPTKQPEPDKPTEVDTEEPTPEEEGKRAE